MKYPNTGALFTSTNKRNDRAPDMFGDIKIEVELLKQLMSKQEDGIVTIKLDGWKKKDKQGKTYLSLAVNRFVPENRGDQSRRQEDDMDGDIPF